MTAGPLTNVPIRRSLWSGGFLTVERLLARNRGGRGCSNRSFAARSDPVVGPLDITISGQPGLAEVLCGFDDRPPIPLRAGGLVISNDPFFISRSDQLAALALRHAVPTIFEFRAFVTAGSLNEVRKQSHRPLPSGRRLYRPRSQGLTSKALGITMPISLLGRADEVIE